MKSFLILSIFVLLINTASGVEQYPSFGITFDGQDVDKTRLNIGQLTTHNVSRDDVFLFDANYRASYENYFHVDGGLGYRNFEGKYGVGWNLFYFVTDKPKFYAHQFSPGLEIFLNRFQISLNHYIPLKPSVINRGFKYQFNTISEVGLTYRPSSRFEFGFIPSFNYGTQKFGVRGSATAFVGNNQFGLAPSYENSKFGISFSISTHFGGPKTRKRQEIRKSRDFSYTGCVRGSPHARVPVIVLKPSPEPKKELVTRDEPAQSTVVVTAAPEPKPNSWTPFFFKGK